MFVFLVHGGQVGYSIIPDLLGQGAVTKKLKRWMIIGMGSMFIVQVGIGGASGMIPITGSCGSWRDWGGVSKNGSKE